MRRLLALACLLVLFCGSSVVWAQAIRQTPTPVAPMATSGGTWTYGGSGTAANAPWVNGSAQGQVRFNVAGKSIVANASMRLAANSGRFAANAVRLNPAALLTTAVAAWLLDYGIRYANDRWEQQTGGQLGTCPLVNGALRTLSTCVALAQAEFAATNWGSGQVFTGVSQRTSGSSVEIGAQIRQTNGEEYTTWVHVWTPVQGQAQPVTWGPAPETWPNALPENAPVPDAAARTLDDLVPLPINAPEPAAATLPIGEPVVVSGQIRIPAVTIAPVPGLAPQADLTTISATPQQITAGAEAPSAGGTTEVNVETCGLPGKPPCKIDESGTPVAGSTVDPAKAAVNAASQARVDQVNAQGTNAPTGWTWLPSLPQGACSALVMPLPGSRQWVLDLCSSPIVQTWRALLGWLVGILGCLYIYRTATGSIGGGRG